MTNKNNFLDAHEEYLRSLPINLSYKQIADRLCVDRGIVSDEKTIMRYYKHRDIPKINAVPNQAGGRRKSNIIPPVGH